MDVNIIIKYKGTEPNEETNFEVRRLLELLIDEAPSESMIKARIINAAHRGYTGMIRVNTSEGSFFTKARDESLIGLATKLVEKVRRQFANWKCIRFQIPNDGDQAYSGEEKTSRAN